MEDKMFFCMAVIFVKMVPGTTFYISVDKK